MTDQVNPVAGFSAGWLQLREPFDAVARTAAAPRLRLDARLAAWRPPAGDPWRVIDLACGTGANLRWLAPRLGGVQQWLVVDHDAALLQCWPDGGAGNGNGNGNGNSTRTRTDVAIATGTGPASRDGPMLHVGGPGFHAAIARRQLDLAQSLERLPWHAAHLVTASALLDLVSADWLQRLVDRAAGARAAVLMALSVDGPHEWAPSDPDDAAVAALFGAHQRRDKGFGGPALGAAAVPALARALRAAGYRVHVARSDWVLDGRCDAQALALQRALIDGLATAAVEQAPASAPTVQAWQRRRQAAAPLSRLVVGHRELLAFPPG